MAAVQISIDTKGARIKIERLLKAAEPRTILDVIGARLMSYVDESFTTSGRGTWQPLAPSTIEARGGGLPLQNTGRYKQSWVLESDGQSFVEIGSSLKTAGGRSLPGIHEFGTGPYTIRVVRARVLAAQTKAGGWKIFGTQVNHPGIPARPVLPSEVVADKLIRDTIDAMVARVMKGQLK